MNKKPSERLKSKFDPVYGMNQTESIQELWDILDEQADAIARLSTFCQSNKADFMRLEKMFNDFVPIEEYDVEKPKSLTLSEIDEVIDENSNKIIWFNNPVKICVDSNLKQAFREKLGG